MTDQRIERLLPMRPRVFAILLLLARGPRHGYGIMRELQESTTQGWLLGPATLYRTLKEMQRLGLIGSAEGPGEESDGPPRRYYELTAAGQAVLDTAVVRYPVPRAIAARVRRLRPARSS